MRAHFSSAALCLRVQHRSSQTQTAVIHITDFVRRFHLDSRHLESILRIALRPLLSVLPAHLCRDTRH